jgi:hypothetical protein
MHIQMVPGLETMAIRMLINECCVITRGDQRIHLAGVDDAHLSPRNHPAPVAVDVVGWVELFAKPTTSAVAMGFVTSSDMRPIWSLYPSYKQSI